MAYDVELTERIRECVGGGSAITEKAMFGGYAFLVNGNMAVSATGQGGLLLRVDPRETEKLVTEQHVERFEMRGRELNGWLHVHPGAISTEADLSRWVGIGVGYARSLKAK